LAAPVVPTVAQSRNGKLTGPQGTIGLVQRL
jgi:hypothetical protein